MKAMDVSGLGIVEQTLDVQPVMREEAHEDGNERQPLELYFGNLFTSLLHPSFVTEFSGMSDRLTLRH